MVWSACALVAVLTSSSNLRHAGSSPASGVEALVEHALVDLGAVAQQRAVPSSDAEVLIVGEEGQRVRTPRPRQKS